MVYYNQDLFTEHEAEVPTTLAEFEAVMDTFVAAGVTPLSVGGAEYPAQQIFYELALSQGDRVFVNDFQLYENPVDFHGPEMSLSRLFTPPVWWRPHQETVHAARTRSKCRRRAAQVVLGNRITDAEPHVAVGRREHMRDAEAGAPYHHRRPARSGPVQRHADAAALHG
jgi:hypothetical protein